MMMLMRRDTERFVEINYDIFSFCIFFHDNKKKERLWRKSDLDNSNEEEWMHVRDGNWTNFFDIIRRWSMID